MTVRKRERNATGSRKPIKIYKSQDYGNTKRINTLISRVVCSETNMIKVSSEHSDKVFVNADLSLNKSKLGGSNSFHYKLIKYRLLKNKGNIEISHNMKRNNDEYRKLCFYSLCSYLQNVKNYFQFDKTEKTININNQNYHIEIERSFLFSLYGKQPKLVIKTVPVLGPNLLSTLSVQIDGKPVLDEYYLTEQDTNVNVIIRSDGYRTELKSLMVILHGEVLIHRAIYIVKIDPLLIDILLNFKPDISKGSDNLYYVNNITYDSNTFQNIYNNRIEYFFNNQFNVKTKFESKFIHYLLSNITQNPIFLTYLITFDFSQYLFSKIYFLYSQIIIDLLGFISEELKCKHNIKFFKTCHMYE